MSRPHPPTTAAATPDAAGQSLQERFAPAGRCFGCGPANPVGLHVASRPSDGDPAILVARFVPLPEHEAFTGVVNGGILGTLLDCHANWTAAWHLMRARGADRPPTTVTLDYAIRMRRPTPSDRPIELRAWVVESSDDRATVEAEISSGDTVTATGRGTFVAVRPDHPAYDRW
jgi:acyl-coenzyme A thioesterase PaaI-like protein